MSVNRGSSHLSNWCLQLTLMLLKVKDTSVMLREGGTPAPRWEQPRIKFSDGRSAAHRAAEPHGDADRLFTATSVL